MDHPPPPAYDVACNEQPVSYDNKLYLNSDSCPPPITSQPHITQPPLLSDVEKLYVINGDRLVYDFERATCCPGQPSGLDADVENQVPTELARVGVDADEWRKWVEELRDIQKVAPTATGCMIMFFCPGLVVQSFLCAMLCPISANHCLTFLPCCYGDWYARLQEWMDKVNLVLNTKDMHAKLMTYRPHHAAPKSKRYVERILGKDEKYEMSMLVIALTKEESLKLQQESWDHGVNDCFPSSRGRIL